MAKSPEEQVRDMIANLQKTTGKSMDEWKSIVQSSGLSKHGEIVKHLKEVYGIGHGYANMITHESLQSHAMAKSAAGEDLTADWFGPDKAAIKAVYDHVMGIVMGFGSDIEQSPKKAYMSLRRNKQFACIGPFTKAKMDVQIQLKGNAPTDRLKEVKGGMTSHVVKVSTIEEVDAELVAWLREAYDRN